MSRGTLDSVRSLEVSGTRLSLPPVCFPKTVPLPLKSLPTVRTPECSHSGLGSSAFARRYLGNRCFFLFLPLLRCFSSRRLPSITYGFSYGYLSSSQAGFPIRISPDRWLFAPPRSFSQLITSFIGFRCQGIHPTLFLA